MKSACACGCAKFTLLKCSFSIDIKLKEVTFWWDRVCACVLCVSVRIIPISLFSAIFPPSFTVPTLIVWPVTRLRVSGAGRGNDISGQTHGAHLIGGGWSGEREGIMSYYYIITTSQPDSHHLACRRSQKLNVSSSDG